MPRWTFVFLLAALIGAAAGFTAGAAPVSFAGQGAFIVGLVLFVVSVVGEARRRPRL